MSRTWKVESTHQVYARAFIRQTELQTDGLVAKIRKRPNNTFDVKVMVRDEVLAPCS